MLITRRVISLCLWCYDWQVTEKDTNIYLMNCWLQKTEMQAVVELPKNASIGAGFQLLVGLAEIHAPRMWVEELPGKDSQVSTMVCKVMGHTCTCTVVIQQIFIQLIGKWHSNHVYNSIWNLEREPFALTCTRDYTNTLVFVKPPSSIGDSYLSR